MKENSQEEKVPQYLYKVLSLDSWEKSQSQAAILLPKDDAKFIHLSKEDQLNRVTEKYWSHVPEYVILKLETAKLPGKLVYEANPGGTSKYYHLYSGSIPLKAISNLGANTLQTTKPEITKNSSTPTQPP